MATKTKTFQSRKLGPHERDSHRRRLLEAIKRHQKKVHTIQLARGQTQTMWEPFLIFPEDDDGIDWDLHDPEDVARAVTVSADNDAKQHGPGWYGVQLLAVDGEDLDAPVFFPVGMESLLGSQDERTDVLLATCRFLQWQNREYANRHFRLLDKFEGAHELLLDAPLQNIEVEKLRLQSELEEFKIEHETRRQAQDQMWDKFGKFVKPIGKAVGEVFAGAAKKFDFGPGGTGTEGINDDDDDDDDDTIPPREPLDRTPEAPVFPFVERIGEVLDPLTDEERERIGDLLGPDLWSLFHGAGEAADDRAAREMMRRMLVLMMDMTKDDRDRLLNDLAVVVGFTVMPKIGVILKAAEQ